MKIAKEMHTKWTLIEKSELLVYLMALSVFVVMLVILTQGKKNHLFQDQSYYKNYMLVNADAEHKKTGYHYSGNTNPAANNTFDEGYTVLQNVQNSNLKSANLITVAENSRNVLGNNASAISYLEKDFNKNQTTLFKRLGLNSILSNEVKSKANERLNKRLLVKRSSKFVKATPILNHQNDNDGVGYNFKLYKVQKGDFLTKIAQKHNLKLSDVLKYNKFKNIDLIFIGSKIKLPIS